MKFSSFSSFSSVQRALCGVAAALLLCCGSARCTDSTASNTAPAKPKGAGLSEDNLFGDKIIAKGKGLEIKRSELDRSLLMQNPARAEEMRIPLQILDRVALNELIHNHLLVARATEAEKKEAKEKIEKTYAEHKKELDAEIRLTALSTDEYLRQLADGVAAQAVARREIAVSVSDADARRFYETNPAPFQVRESVHGNYIMLATRDLNTGVEMSAEAKDTQLKKAEQAVKRARSGEDFIKLVDQFSEDPTVKQNHGEIMLQENDSRLAPETRLAIFALNTNTVSDVITTPQGYYIFKIKERIPAGKLDYDKVVAQLKPALTNMAFQQELPHYFDKLWNDADVKVLDDKLKLKQ